MKKLLLGAMILAASFTNSFAQEVEVNWGTSFDAKTEVQKIIGTHDGVMYVYSKKMKKNYLQGFIGDDNNQKFSEEYMLPNYNGEKTKVIDMIMTDVGPLAIGYQLNKKTGKIKVYGQNFDLSGRIQGKGIVILETSNPVKMKNHSVEIYQSRDKSKFMFTYIRNEKKVDILHADIVVLDNELGVLSNRNSEYDFSEVKGEDRSYTYEVHLDNDGSYITSIQESVNRKDQEPEYSFTIKDFSASGEELANKTVNFEDKGIYKPYIFFDESENSFRVVGMYAEFKGRKNKIPGYSGVYTAVIERGSLDVLDKTSTPFPDSYMQEFYSEKKIEKSKDKDKNLYVSSGFGIDNVQITPEGNMVISAEFYSKERVQRDGKWYTVYTYGDIMVLSISAEGELNWINHIDKYQQTTVRDIPIIVVAISAPEPAILNNWSYITGLGENHYYLLFNDHKKNSEDVKDNKRKAMVNPKKSLPFQVSIDLETGEQRKKAMISSEQEETYMAPKVFYRLSDSKFIIWAVKRKENKFGVVNFK